VADFRVPQKEFGPQTTQNDAEGQGIARAAHATQGMGRRREGFPVLIFLVFCVLCGPDCRNLLRTLKPSATWC
jgi:hypothetical protein